MTRQNLIKAEDFRLHYERGENGDANERLSQGKELVQQWDPVLVEQIAMLSAH